MVNVPGFLIVLALAAIPAVIWLLFFLKEDSRKPEPGKMLSITFIAGMAASAPVLLLELLFRKMAITPLHSLLLFIVGIALIEEVFKFFAAYAVNNKNKRFDEPVDAMIYMITAALGFATVENFFIVKSGLDAINLSTMLSTLNSVALRFIGATLLHALASGIVGYSWAQRRFGKRRGVIFLGLFFASGVHALFNFFVVRFQATDVFYPTFFLVVIAFWVLADFERAKG